MAAKRRDQTREGRAGKAEERREGWGVETGKQEERKDHALWMVAPLPIPPIHLSSHKYSLSTYYVPDTILGPRMLH